MALRQINEQIERAKAEQDRYEASAQWSADQESAKKELGLAVRAAVTGIIFEAAKDGWPIDVEASLELARAMRDGQVYWVMLYNLVVEFSRTEFGEQGSPAQVVAEMQHRGYPVVLDRAAGPVNLDYMLDRG